MQWAASAAVVFHTYRDLLGVLVCIPRRLANVSAAVMLSALQVVVTPRVYCHSCSTAVEPPSPRKGYIHSCVLPAVQALRSFLRRSLFSFWRLHGLASTPRARVTGAYDRRFLYSYCCNALRGRL